MNDWLTQRGRIYWYDQYALNESDTAFAAYDPDRIVDEICATGADIVAIYAANQFAVAYYPSDVWPMHPRLAGRDYFGELATRFRARGKKIIAYINWLDSKHPEWNLVPLAGDEDNLQGARPLVSWADPDKPDGAVQDLPGGRWQLPCYNSPRRDGVISVAREILDRYQPDMFHLDMVSNSDVCLCPYCIDKLAEICGTREITREVVHENWIEFIDWRRESAGSLMRDVARVVRESGALVASNVFSPLSHMAITGMDLGWMDDVDVFLSECFDAFNAPGSDLNATSVNVRLQHACSKPSWILRTSTPLHYGHFPITKAQWKIYAAASKTNGAHVFGPCGVGARPDTTSAKTLLDNVRTGLDFFMDDADLADGARSAARVGLVFSWATRRYRSPGADRAWVEDFNGWARMLIESHVPFDIVSVEHTEGAPNLERYDLLILPGLTHLDQHFCTEVGKYVKGGGKIIMTGETSLYDENGSPRQDFALGEVAGIALRGRRETPFAIENEPDPEPAEGVLVEVDGDGLVVEWTLKVDPAGSVLSGKDPMALDERGTAFVVENDFGDGMCLYVAFAVGQYYDIHGDAHIYERMRRWVDKMLAERSLRVNAPLTVEVTSWEQPQHARTIIHLANRTVAWSIATNRRQIREVVSVDGVMIELKIDREDPTVTCRHAKAEWEIIDGLLRARISGIKEYAALVVE